VVATSVGGNIELVDHENGICCPPGDHQALAIALQRLMDDEHLRKNLAAKSLKKIQQSYSWDKAMAELEGYYLTLVADSI
jgi:glycosyltransferase involved in cell wall biosynthesis